MRIRYKIIKTLLKYKISKQSPIYVFLFLTASKAHITWRERCFRKITTIDPPNFNKGHRVSSLGEGTTVRWRGRPCDLEKDVLVEARTRALARRVRSSLVARDPLLATPAGWLGKSLFTFTSLSLSLRRAAPAALLQ